MPRKKGNKSKKEKLEIKSKEKVQPKADPIIRSLPIIKSLDEKQLEALETISYEAYTRFIRNDEDVVIVVYEVPTMRLTNEDQIRNWKLGLETALVSTANKRRLIITRDKFHFKALPQGEITLLKAFFRMNDVIGGAGKEQHFRQRPPPGKEGLIIEE